jgi:hypothetical protein
MPVQIYSGGGGGSSTPTNFYNVPAGTVYDIPAGTLGICYHHTTLDGTITLEGILATQGGG